MFVSPLLIEHPLSGEHRCVCGIRIVVLVALVAKIEREDILIRVHTLVDRTGTMEMNLDLITIITGELAGVMLTLQVNQLLAPVTALVAIPIHSLRHCACPLR